MKLFDWLLIIGITLLNLIYSILQKDFDVVGSLAAVSGVVCVVLVAKGNILNYLFGLINVSLYAYIAFKAALYGDAVLNAAYYLPMQFIGFYLWTKRRQNKNTLFVKAKRMNCKQRIWLIVISAVLVLIVGLILDYLKDPQPYKDSATTVLSVIAMFIMVRTFMEQWFLWIIVNVISIVMWVFAFINGESHSILMIMMWCAYLLNSINGWLVWNKLSKARVD